MLVGAVVLASAYEAAAALTRIAGPTPILSESRLLVKFDTAFDTLNQVYLAVWGTQHAGPTNGQFLNTAGAPIGAPFAISDGPSHAGWARAIYSPEERKFLVSYTKILGPASHQRVARFVTYQSATSRVLSPEIVIDTWTGGAGTATGMAYSRGKFLVTWWNFNLNPPQTYVAVLDAAGNISAKEHISLAGDGQTDSEIDCDPGHGRCLVIGHSWGVFSPTGDPGTWGQFINDQTGARIGEQFIVYGRVQKEDSVVFSSAGSRFLVVFSRLQNEVWGMTVDANTQAVGAPYRLRRPLEDPDDGGGYGLPRLVYNPRSQTTLLAMVPWIARTAAMELDATGAQIPGTFQMTPVAGHWTQGTKEIAPAADAVNSRFLIADNQAFLTMRSTAFQAGQSDAPPPPPPCSYSISATAANVTPNAQSGTLGITTAAGCAWAATSSASWLTVGATSGTGSATLTFNVTTNTQPVARTATISVAGHIFTVTQARASLAAVHDISGDGRSDLMWHHQGTGALGVWEISGNTVMATYRLNAGPVADTNWKVVGTGDLNGDGFADIIWRHLLTGRVAAWFLQGPNVIQSQALMLSGVAAVEPDPDWHIRAVGDLNGDGRADLIWQHATVGTLAAWFMDGFSVTSTSPLSVSPMTDPAWKIAAAGDISGDGRADIVWQNDVTGVLAAWLMNGSEVMFQQRLSHSVSDVSWKVRGLGDTNGDGIADLIWQNTANGRLGVWYLNGFNVAAMNSLIVGASTAAVPDTNWHVAGPG